MNWKEALTIMASLAAVLGFGLTILEMVTPNETIQQVPASPPPQKIVILARTAFNDSGTAYALSFNDEVIRLNNSVQVVYLWSA